MTYERLLLGQIPDDFDPKRDLPIGPWCFQGKEHIFPQWDDLPFVDPYDDTTLLVRDSDRLRQVAEVYCRRLAKRFEYRKNTGHSYRCWRIMLLPWLLYVLQVAWRRYFHVKAFVQRYNDLSLTAVCATRQADWDVENLLDLENLFTQHGFNYWLTSLAVDKLAPSNWQCIEDNKTIGRWRATTVVEKDGGWKQRLFRKLNSSRCRFVYGPHWINPLLSLYLFFLPARTLRDCRQSAAEETGGIFDDEPLDLHEIIITLLDALFPRSLAVSLSCLNGAPGGQSYRRGKLNVVGPILMYSDHDKLQLAMAVDAGEQIICTQHGGSGFRKVNTNSVAVENGQDGYLSWGWRRQESYEGHVIPAPSPFLSQFADRHRETRPELIFVGNTMKMFSTRLESSVQGNYCLRYRKQKLRFLENLDTVVRKRVRYRPCDAQYQNDIDDGAYVRRHFPQMRFLEGSSRHLHRRLFECRLVVVDFLATTFCIALSANVPMVAFCDLEHVGVSRQARPLVNGLIEAGVLHSDGASAARQVNRIWSSPHAWWRQASIQDARRRFCHCYARTDRRWPLAWARILWQFANRSGCDQRSISKELSIV